MSWGHPGKEEVTRETGPEAGSDRWLPTAEQGLARSKSTQRFESPRQPLACPVETERKRLPDDGCWKGP